MTSTARIEIKIIACKDNAVIDLCCCSLTWNWYTAVRKHHDEVLLHSLQVTQKHPDHLNWQGPSTGTLEQAQIFDIPTERELKHFSVKTFLSITI